MWHGTGWPGVSVSPDGPSPVVSSQVCGRSLRLLCSRTFGVSFSGCPVVCAPASLSLSHRCLRLIWAVNVFLKYCCKQSVIFFAWKEGIFFFSFVFFLFFLCFCLWFVSVRILLRTCVTGDPAHLPAVFLFIAALFRRCRDGAKRWSEGVCWILGICLWGFCCHGSRVNKHVWRYDGSGYDAAGARANEPFTSWGSAADAARG